MKPFNEDQIRRTGLPQDVMGLIHDLCYHVNNNLRGTMDERAVENYCGRAQEILREKTQDTELNKNTLALLMAIEDMKRYIKNDKHIPWNNVIHFADKVKQGLS